MAVIDKYEATVQIDGKDLIGFADDHGHDSSSTDIAQNSVFVLAKSNTNFTMRFKLKNGFTYGQGVDYLVFKIWIDGKCFGGRRFSKTSYPSGRAVHKTIEGRTEISGDTVFRRCLMFDDLKIRTQMPGEASVTLKSQYANLGQIKLEVWKKSYCTVRMRQPSPTSNENDLEPIPEIALKGQALGLTTKLGAKEELKEWSQIPGWKGQKVGSRPLAIFIFKYRTEEDLKQMGILSRTPTPVPLEDRDIDSLSPAEAMELLKRQKAQVNAMNVRIKRESQEKNLQVVNFFKRARTNADTDDDAEVVAAPAKKVLRLEYVELD